MRFTTSEHMSYDIVCNQIGFPPQELPPPYFTKILPCPQQK